MTILANIRLQHIVVFILILLGTACGTSTKPEDRFKTDDVAENANVEPVSIKTQRLDQDLFTYIKQGTPADGYAKLKAKYGDLFDLYLLELAGFTNPADPQAANKVLAFTTDKTITELKAASDKKYPNLNFLDSALSLGFTRYKAFFPNKPIPKVVTCITALFQPLTVTQNELVISLDYYLGRNFEFYDWNQIPKYITLSSDKPYIASNALWAWCSTEFEDTTATQTLLTKIVNQGKVLYLVDALLPDVPDSIKLRYTTKQTTWAAENEESVWKFLVDKKLLYNTNNKQTDKFTAEAPFTAGLDNTSPPRIGSYIGWQIVKAYMRKNTSLSMADLFKQKNAQQILNDSGYRPIAIQ